MRLKFNFKLCASFFVVFFSFWATNIIAEPNSESIINFNSYIIVNENDSIYVEEKIEVFSKQERIRHGIYRDFPTVYQDKAGRKIRIPVRILDISRDGQQEDFSITPIDNGIRIYIGNKNSYIPYGIHTYVIRYKVARQVGFFKDFDEIYWNATGNFWDFPIEHARAVVQLPIGAKIIREAAYAGVFGSTGRDYTYRLDENGDAVFETTQLLQPREGLTIAVDFDKGFVIAPTSTDDFIFTVTDNLGQIIMLVWIAFLLPYYIIAWRKVRMPDRRGTIIPLFEPPKDLSPAAVAHILTMGSVDNKLTFPSAIVDLAVKGFLKIKKETEEYTLQKLKDPTSDLPEEEYSLIEDILKETDIITFNHENGIKIGEAIRQFSTTLNERYTDLYFSRNLIYVGIGFLGSAVVFGMVALMGSEEFFSNLMSNSIGTLAGIVLCTALILNVKQLFHNSSIFSAAIQLFKLVFVCVIFVAIFGISTFVYIQKLASADFYAFLANASGSVVVVIHAIFIFLLKQPTVEGRKIMDQIEGFKLYLSVTERDRYKILNSPKVTTDIFEKYLPFAIALGVEEEWSKKLSDGYTPNWYEGEGNMMFGSRTGGFVPIGSSMGSNLSSIAPAAAAGSSSGGGGGGSSGGGGGGGGGGGW